MLFYTDGHIVGVKLNTPIAENGHVYEYIGVLVFHDGDDKECRKDGYWKISDGLHVVPGFKHYFEAGDVYTIDIPTRAGNKIIEEMGKDISLPTEPISELTPI